MPRIYFSRQDQNLLFITWWFKEHNVVGIETDISSFFALVKYILNNMDHRQISAMTPFREEIGIRLSPPDWSIRLSRTITLQRREKTLSYAQCTRTYPDVLLESWSMDEHYVHEMYSKYVFR